MTQTVKKMIVMMLKAKKKKIEKKTFQDLMHRYRLKQEKMTTINLRKRERSR